MSRRTPLVSLFVAALVLGASAPVFAGSSDDEAIAEDSVLTEDDLADYGLEETEPDQELPPNVSECKKVRAVVRAAKRRPNAVTAFDDGAATSAESQVVVYPSVKAARVPLAAYSASAAADCIETQLKDSLEQSLEPGSEYEFSGGTIDVPLGDDSIVYQITVTVTDPEGALTDLYLEFGLIRVGRGIAVLQFQSVDGPFDGSEDLATLVVDNLTSNLEA